MNKQSVEKLIGSYPDFPKQGILFYDIHPLMLNLDSRKWVTDHLTQRYKGM